MAKILVYDVDAQFRNSLQAALASLGHETVAATDGYSVLPLAEMHRPALVILDYNPPETDGSEILKRLRASAAFAATPVIFASATPKFEIEMVVMDAPAVGYVDKPLDVKQLQEAIASFIAAPKPASDSPKANRPVAAPPAAGIPPPGAPLSPPVFSGEPDLDGVRDDVIDLD